MGGVLSVTAFATTVGLGATFGLFGLTHRRKTLRRVAAGEPAAFWSLAAVEVAVMAAVLGIAVTLTATSPGDDTDSVHAAPAATALHFTLP